MDNDDSLVKRILRDLKIIFERDLDMIEFDIIPVEDKICNKSPVIVESNRLGIESWSIKHVYRYTYRQFIESRKNRTRVENANLNEWTRTLLLLNPELRTAWNCRKNLVLEDALRVRDELKFSQLILTRRNKSPETFAYREWILNGVYKSQGFLDNEQVEHELEVCLTAANRYANNYHAWDHRRWIINHLAEEQLTLCPDELSRNRAWVEKHISDYSGFSYRQFLINFMSKHCFENRIAYLDFLVSELTMIESLAQLFIGQESLFTHRRFLLTEVDSICGSKNVEFETREKLFIRNQREISQQNSEKWCLQLVERHCDWLKRKLKWQIETS